MSKFVGCCKVEVFDKESEITFPMLVVYPTNTASKPVAFGPFSLDVSMEAPAADGRYSLVMISHGSGGSNLTHRTLGMYWAKNGFVVGMPEHPFNNRHNNELQYTIEVTADSRIKAIVLWAPDVSLFMLEGALRHVHAPILLLAAEKDYMPRETVEMMMNRIPERSQLIHRIVKNAGHYSFLSPFPESLKSRVGDAAKDLAGFDRDQFHQELNMEVLSFLKKSFGSRNNLNITAI